MGKWSSHTDLGLVVLCFPVESREKVSKTEKRQEREKELVKEEKIDKYEEFILTPSAGSA